MPSPQKFQRWIDLLAALLNRRLPATFDELARDVPEYAEKQREIEATDDESQRDTLRESLKRTFERDKQELKTFGLPIESLLDPESNTIGLYRLQKANFYLPYLCVALPDGTTTPANRLDKYGYQNLKKLSFEPDELRAVVDSAALVRTVGDPLLAADATNALRKLAVDLPVDASAIDRLAGDRTPGDPDRDRATGTPHILPPRARAGSAIFEALGDALRRRKRVTFRYHTFADDRTATRTVEPYGLFFLHGHWYLAARDPAQPEVRNFRLNRISDVTVNSARALSPDFATPAAFRLHEHAKSRQAWELGDEDVAVVTVEFTGSSGPALAAAQLGRPVDGAPTQRTFEVKRVDPFVRWALSFAGELRVLHPPAIVERVAHEAELTLAQYQRDAAPVSETDIARPGPLPLNTGSTHWQPKGAAAQLQRILQLIPQLSDGDDHPIDEVATQAGVDPATVYRDLESLVHRYELPAGHVEGVQLYLESERVRVISNHFLRPMRLTSSELCALELGLTMLQSQRTPADAAVIQKARERLRDIIVTMGSDPMPDGIHHATIGETGSIEALDVIRRALVAEQRVRLVYRKSGSSVADEREICPFALVASNGALYVVAHCVRENGLRVFRMDRVQTATALNTPFTRPTDFQLDAVLADGKVFQGEAAERLVIRYSAQIARWIAERDGVQPGTDGSLVLAYPLADEAWATRFVLQYGAAAEVLSPAAVREGLREQLEAMLTAGR